MKTADEILKEKFPSVYDLSNNEGKLIIEAMEDYAFQFKEQREITNWIQIEKDFIEWDNASHSNASQRQILDWFKEKLVKNK